VLARHDHDDFEFVLGEKDLIELEAGNQMRVAVTGSDNFGRRITCNLFMTAAQLARLKQQIDDVIAKRAARVGDAAAA
jgi:hypothetical protein